MSKRMTDTAKWNDPWFRRLSPKLKCLWMFICDTCDPAGVIDLDLELAATFIGQKFDRDDLLNFDTRLERLENGKLWVKKFVEFQFGALSRECRPHKAVFDALAKSFIQYPFNTLPQNPEKGINDTLPNKEPDKDRTKTEGVQGEPKKARGTVYELKAFAVELGLPESDGEACFHKWEGNGWKNGDTPIKDWKSTIRAWKINNYLPSQKPNRTNGNHRTTQDREFDRTGIKGDNIPTRIL